MTIAGDLRALEAEALTAVDAAATLDERETVRVGDRGRKGSLTAGLRGLGALGAEERPDQRAWLPLILALDEPAFDAAAVRSATCPAPALFERVIGFLAPPPAEAGADRAAEA